MFMSQYDSTVAVLFGCPGPFDLILKLKGHRSVNYYFCCTEYFLTYFYFLKYAPINNIGNQQVKFSTFVFELINI